MTYAEKFRQAFGFLPMASEEQEICKFMYCAEEETECKNCPYQKAKWGDEIKEENK